MKFKIGSLTIEVTWDRRPTWEKNAKRLALKIDFPACAFWHAQGGNLKIWRIKLFREMAIYNGWDASLTAAKEWVEKHFADNGYGDPL